MPPKKKSDDVSALPEHSNVKSTSWRGPLFDVVHRQRPRMGGPAPRCRRATWLHRGRPVSRSASRRRTCRQGVRKESSASHCSSSPVICGTGVRRRLIEPWEDLTAGMPQRFRRVSLIIPGDLLVLILLPGEGLRRARHLHHRETRQRRSTALQHGSPRNVFLFHRYPFPASVYG